MDTRFVVTTYSCGHATVSEEDMPPTSIWQGLKRNVTTQALQEFRYEDSYHDCEAYATRKKSELAEQEPSPFSFLMTQPVYSTVPEQSHLKFIFNADSPAPEVKLDSEYSSFSIEISEYQEMVFPQLPRRRNLMQRIPFQKRIASSRRTPSPAVEDSSSVEDTMPETIPEESDHPSNDTSDTPLEEPLDEEEFSRIMFSPPPGEDDKPSSSNVSTASSEDSFTPELIVPFSPLGLEIIARSRIYFSAPPDMIAPKILTIGGDPLIRGLESKRQRIPPHWGVVDMAGNKYSIKTSRADMDLRISVIGNLKLIYWEEFVRRGVYDGDDYENDSARSSSGYSYLAFHGDDSSDESSEDEGLRPKKKTTTKAFNRSILISHETLPTLDDEAQRYFPYEKGCSNLRREWLLLER
jgi:hypothetical protein